MSLILILSKMNLIGGKRRSKIHALSKMGPFLTIARQWFQLTLTKPLTVTKNSILDSARVQGRPLIDVFKRFLPDFGKPQDSDQNRGS